MKVEIRKIFEGNHPFSDVYARSLDLHVFKNQNLQYICGIDREPVLNSQNQKLDGFRGPKAIIAKVPDEAAKQLCLAKPGWYSTDVPLNYF